MGDARLCGYRYCVRVCFWTVARTWWKYHVTHRNPVSTPRGCRGIPRPDVDNLRSTTSAIATRELLLAGIDKHFRHHLVPVEVVGPVCVARNEGGPVLPRAESPCVRRRMPRKKKKVTKGRCHTVEKRLNMHPRKPHATSQPSRLSHTFRPGTHSPHNRYQHIH